MSESYAFPAGIASGRGGSTDMASGERPLVIVVPAGPRTRTLLAWLRQLVPAAVLLVASPVPGPLPRDVEVIALDTDTTDASPLSLADTIAKIRSRS
jgi:hypothetical protein